MSIKFFEIAMPVHVRENDEPVRDHTLTVRVEMGATATAEDAVRWLAEKLESLCNDHKPYEGG